MNLFNSSLFGGQTSNLTGTVSKPKSETLKMKASKLQKFLSVKEYACSEDQNGKYRNSMEDKILIEDGFCEQNLNGLFTLYDGHGGSDCVDFVVKRFPSMLSKKLEENDDVIEAIKQAINGINKDVMFYSSESSGTTAAIALIKGNFLFTANVGDSKIILVDILMNNCKTLSVDHKLSNESEKERILLAGGIIKKDRVNGSLVLSRSIGDHFLTSHGVISDPSTSVELISEKEGKYLILASDGVWDVITDKILLDIIIKYANCEEICNHLISESKELGSADNISCIAIKL